LDYVWHMVSATARRLGADQTDVEKRLWHRLRNRGLVGLKFRRQVPLRDFVADFVCAEQALVIELDGGQHSSSEARDERRTAWLESRGWRVIRFWNNEVNENIEGVLTAIAAACGVDLGGYQPVRHRRPHPDPLPRGEGEAAVAVREKRPRRMLSRGFAPRKHG